MSRARQPWCTGEGNRRSPGQPRAPRPRGVSSAPGAGRPPQERTGGPPSRLHRRPAAALRSPPPPGRATASQCRQPPEPADSLQLPRGEAAPTPAPALRAEAPPGGPSSSAAAPAGSGGQVTRSARRDLSALPRHATGSRALPRGRDNTRAHCSAAVHSGTCSWTARRRQSLRSGSNYKFQRPLRRSAAPGGRRRGRAGPGTQRAGQDVAPGRPRHREQENGNGGAAAPAGPGGPRRDQAWRARGAGGERRARPRGWGCRRRRRPGPPLSSRGAPLCPPAAGPRCPPRLPGWARRGRLLRRRSGPSADGGRLWGGHRLPLSSSRLPAPEARQRCGAEGAASRGLRSAHSP